MERAFHIVLGVLLLMGLARVTTASAQKIPYDNKLVVGQLENGLTYYVYPNDNPKGQAIYRLFVKTGSVVEEDNQRGLAHFLEHLAFNGTRRFPSNSIVKFLETYGAKFGQDINAHTSFCETVYKLQLPTASPALVDSALAIMADWASALTLAPEEIDKERGVILSERLARSTEQQKVSNVLLEELLNHSVYSRRMTIGDSAIIASAQRDVIADYFHRWYQPQMMAVAVVGDVNPEDIVRMIRQNFGSMPKGKSKVNPIPRIPEYAESQARIRTWEKCKENTLDVIQLVAPLKSVDNEKVYREYIMRKIINRMAQSRFNTLSFDNPAYNSGEVEFSELLGATGVNISSVKLVKGKVADGIRDFLAHRRQLLDYGFTSSEIRKARKSMIGSLKARMESGRSQRSESIVDEIYADYYRGNRLCSAETELQLTEKYLPRIDSVAVLKAIKRMTGKGHIHYLLRGENGILKEVPDSFKLMQMIAEDEKMPVERYNKYVDVPDCLCQVPWKKHIVSETTIPQLDATDIRLDNGARVIYKRTSNDRGRIYMSGYRKGGLYSVDSVDYHTALVGPNVIALSGVGQMSREAYSMYMAGKQASSQMLVDKMRCGVSGSASLKDAETMMQQLYVKWTEPRLDTAVARLTKDKMMEAWRTKIPTRKDKFVQKVSWMINGRNYTNGELTDTVIRQEVNTSRMLPMYHRLFGSARDFTFIVMADSPLDSLRSLIEQYIGALPGGETDCRWRINGRQICRHDTTLVSTAAAGVSRATVQMVWQQDHLSDSLPSCHSRNQMMATALKSVLRTALLKRLREDMGKVYSVSVSSSTSPYPTPLSRTIVAFACKPQDVDLLMAETERVIADFVKHPGQYSSVLEDVRQSMLKDYGIARQKTTFWLGGIRNNLFMGNDDWTWLTDYDAHIRQLTIDDLSQYAEKVISKGIKLRAVYEE